MMFFVANRKGFCNFDLNSVFIFLTYEAQVRFVTVKV
jgi:hypothetical protein